MSNPPTEEQTIELLRSSRAETCGTHSAAAQRGILAAGTDSYFAADSPLGEMYVGVSEKGIRYITTRQTTGSGFARDYGERFGRLITPADEQVRVKFARLLERAFAGEKVRIPLDLSGKTDFQRRVLEVVGGIPHGEVRPYGWVAAEAGRPGASRAVGTIMAKNPIPLVVPCHRVIKSDGSPGNYAFDPEKKIHLLKGEGVPIDDLARAPYLATPTTGVVCHATCRNARRIKPENRREFKSIHVALDSGFRPCRVCRPAVAA